MIRFVKNFLSIAFAAIISTCVYGQKFDSLALTPQMGWNSWNKFACDINEDLIKSIADAMVSSGLKDAGYIYVNLDDCWHGKRDSLGFITADPVRFPHGIKALADYIHKKGLKIGIYSDAGRKTCAGRPGSLGHEYQDALTYAKWNIDYLKYDWCYTKDVNPRCAYPLMRDALYSAGRPILFSMCEWGSDKPWEWAADVGNSWRTTGDISCVFDAADNKGNYKRLGVVQIINKNAALRKFAGPGHWNDPDMLEVGNGMPINEDRAHFTMWCMMAAPLILGNDIRSMNEATREIIENKSVIAIDQDKLGIQGLRFEIKDSVQVWLKPLENGNWAFCLLNTGKRDKTFDIFWQKYNLEDNVSGLSTSFYKEIYSITNLWNGKNCGTTAKKCTVIVPAHDVVLYRLVPLKKNDCF
ncbi:MAG: glycoside hydrolase family 27 protein [Bacteroidales bacterium]|nr:glycoside hydrolase family 27 protein [Bacteroidales bacterium]